VHVSLLILILVITSIIFFLIGFFSHKKLGDKKLNSAEKLSEQILKEAENKISEANSEAKIIKINAENRKKEILLDAKEESIKIKSSAEKEIRIQKNDLMHKENKLLQKEDQIERKREILEKKEDNFNKKSERLELKRIELDRIIGAQRLELEKISGLDAASARQIFLENIKKEVSGETNKIIKEIEAKAKLEADKRVSDILMNAMQRCNIEHVTESAVSVVTLPNDEMKGKIIGREGRNIRTLEALTGIDIIIDDTPEAVVLSGFSSVRREVARIALEKLVLDGRIHPTRIEEVVEKSKKEIENIIFEEGEAATYETGVQDLHIEIIKLLGRMKYRTSYGQNALKHSIEVAHLSGLIASEIGCNIALAKRAGLLHDIGKAVDHETEGSHVQIGVSICKKYRESEIIINSIEAHHGDVEAKNIISVIVQIADAMSAARPGARRETLESYIKRLEKLERIAESFESVEKSFAIHAGRELRIIVMPEKIRDEDLNLLAKDIAHKIEKEIDYPGQIKVSIIRETRAIEYAK